IGPNALLTILERDLGLSGAFLSQLERRVKYREIIAHYLETNPDVPVKQSFEVDPEGVTSELLMFRDQLILAGWTQKIKGISTIIDLLANLEEKAEVPAGTEDRWMAVLRTLQNIKQVRFCIEVIQMHDDVEDMHPFFRKLFEELRNHGIQVIGSEKD